MIAEPNDLAVSSIRRRAQGCNPAPRADDRFPSESDRRVDRVGARKKPPRGSSWRPLIFDDDRSDQTSSLRAPIKVRRR